MIWDWAAASQQAATKRRKQGETSIGYEGRITEHREKQAVVQCTNS